jgi:chromosome segregation ATPase
MKPEETKSDIEKLEEEISSLKSKIKNTEYDLSNMFKGNVFLEKKLESAKKNLTEKQELLQKIKSQPESLEKLQDVENNLQQDNSVSQDQEKITKELIEEEL